jgi:cyclopropane-fatty-acyl-phospholipid synthase
VSLVARRVSHALLDRIEAGRVTLSEPCRPVGAFGPCEPATGLRAHVHVHDARAWQALLRGSATFGVSYADGWWDTDDLVSLVRIVARDIVRLDRQRARALPVLTPLQSAVGHVRRNTIGRARRQIAAHYDLDNGLFEEMLDETMTYSCALFRAPGADLADAQNAKLGRVCERLELDERDHLLEIGSGWGALALHAARSYGCRVTTTTISSAQYSVARRRVRQAGLEHLVTVLPEDYRRLQGRFDKLVSIEMIEAVGWRHLPTFFRCLGERLRPEGLVLLQATTTGPIAHDLVRGTKTFIQHVFPGGDLPSLEVIAGAAGRCGDLRIVGLEDLTAHYVLTLEAWRERFLRAERRLASRGYDERFRRMWTFYLSYCQAGFAERRIQNHQILLAGPERRSEVALEGTAWTSGSVLA